MNHRCYQLERHHEPSSSHSRLKPKFSQLLKWPGGVPPLIKNRCVGSMYKIILPTSLHHTVLLLFSTILLGYTSLSGLLCVTPVLLFSFIKAKVLSALFKSVLARLYPPLLFLPLSSSLPPHKFSLPLPPLHMCVGGVCV